MINGLHRKKLRALEVLYAVAKKFRDEDLKPRQHGEDNPSDPSGPLYAALIDAIDTATCVVEPIVVEMKSGAADYARERLHNAARNRIPGVKP